MYLAGSKVEPTAYDELFRLIDSLCVQDLYIIYMCPFTCSIREFMAFSSSVIVERTQVGQRQTVKEQGNLLLPTAYVQCQASY